MPPRTPYGWLLHQVEVRPDVMAAVHPIEGRWEALTWAQIGDQVQELALGLLTLDLKPGDRVALIARSQLQWATADLAINACGAVATALLDRFPVAELANLLAVCRCKIAVVDISTARALLPHLQRMPELEHLLVMEGEGVVALENPGAHPNIITLDSVQQRGRAARASRLGQLTATHAAVREQDPAAMLSTVGTTEKVKLAVLSHDAVAYEIEATARLALVSTTDRVLVCMPLAHAFSRVWLGLWTRAGFCIAFADSTPDLFDRIRLVQPTVLAAPPRVFELLYGTIVRSGQIAGGGKRRIFAWGMKQARKQMLREGNPALLQLGWNVARRAVFEPLTSRLRILFGDQLRLFVTGGAPLADRIAYFFDYAGVHLMPTYGLTETGGISCVNFGGREKIGTVGPPLPGTEIRIAPDGEILVRGRGVMLGYWREPDAAVRISEEGFLHTGDVGELDPDGFLRVSGRRDQLIHLEDGSVVSPHRVEMALRTNAFVGHAYVEGCADGTLVALLSLDPENIRAWARQRELPFNDFANLARSPEVRRLMDEVVADRNRRFRAGRGIKRYAIADHPFSIGDELTATMRVRRRYVQQKYRVTLDAIHGRDDLGDP